MTLGVRRSFDLDPREIAAASRGALDGALEGDAELWIARPTSEAIVLGAFQRPADAENTSETEVAARPLVRRGSGGPAVRVGPGSLWVSLVLPRVDALTSCDEARIVNRYVRPLLRALTRQNALAHYFGRDWISVQHRPAGWVGFAHDSASGRVVLEAVLAVNERFDVTPRASFLGKQPGTLTSILGAPIDLEKLQDGIVAAYASAYGRAAVDLGELPRVADLASDVDDEPPWAASTEEAIGPVCAGADATGRLRVGGDLLVSRDALASLEAALPLVRADDHAEADVAALVDAKLAAPHVALDGVRSLTSVRDVIVRALAQKRA